MAPDCMARWGWGCQVSHLHSAPAAAHWQEWRAINKFVIRQNGAATIGGKPSSFGIAVVGGIDFYVECSTEAKRHGRLDRS